MASRFFVKAFSALNKWCNTDNTVARIAVNGNIQVFLQNDSAYNISEFIVGQVGPG